MIVFFTACVREPEMVFETSTVIAKTQEVYIGNTKYVLALENGQTRSVTFTYYFKHDVGDKVYLCGHVGWGTKLYYEGDYNRLLEKYKNRHNE